MLKSFKSSFSGREAIDAVCRFTECEKVVDRQDGPIGLSHADEMRLFGQCLCQVLLQCKFIFHMLHKNEFKDSGSSFFGLCKNMKMARIDFQKEYTLSHSPKSTESQQHSVIQKRKSFSLSLNLKKITENKETVTHKISSDSSEEDNYEENELPIGYISSARFKSNTTFSPIIESKSQSFQMKKGRRNTLLPNQLIIPKLNLNQDGATASPLSAVEISKPFGVEFVSLTRQKSSLTSETATTASDESSGNSQSQATQKLRPSPQKSNSGNLDISNIPKRSSLSDVLRDNFMREQFKQFSTDEYSSENVLFYEEVLKFLTSLFLSEEQQRDLATKLYELFIPDTSLYQLNIPSKLMIKFHKEYQTKFANLANVVLLFKEALTEIEHVMSDTYKRFKLGKVYQQYKLRTLLEEKDETDGFTTSRY